MGWGSIGTAGESLDLVRFFLCTFEGLVGFFGFWINLGASSVSDVEDSGTGSRSQFFFLAGLDLRFVDFPPLEELEQADELSSK